MGKAGEERARARAGGRVGGVEGGAGDPTRDSPNGSLMLLAGGLGGGPCLVQIKLGPDRVPARFPRAAALSSMSFSKQSNKIGISDVGRARGGGRG